MKKILFLSILFIGIISCKKENQIAKTKIIPNEKAIKLDTLFSELFQNGAFNGNVLVAEKGNVVFQKSYGLSNEKSKEKLNEQTIFELASVSKQFTAMGIVQLVKNGELSYDDLISEYIPELNKYENITIKNLLTHTGGLSDYMALSEDNWDKTKIATNDDMINLFKKIEPKKKFEPNDKWDYSNTGYLILATIIERVSELPFEQYLNENVFKPLKMENTFIYRRRFQPKEVKNYAEGYIYSDSLKRKILPDELGKEYYSVYLDGIVGDGMVNSNVTDLLKWDRALYVNSIINEKDRKMIFSSYKTKDNSETDYGFGWMIDSTKIYGKIVSHSGGWAGYRTYIERDLDNDKTIIILQNNSTSKTEMPIKNTRRILYNQKVEKPIKLDNSILKIYAGKYLNSKQREKEIRFENDKLYVVMSPDFKMELIPVSKTKFIVDGYSPEVTYTFIIDKNGEVEKYRVQQESQGIDKEAKRIK
ncbi:serine hydrolase domain-containing protein [Tenacibaculum finnmarkense]|uniref:serine hydrolase domain-containing protein n=1 Tax=Tenacibaculum finnmarkense TaxID=2781243 RepID=UPI001E2FBB64|nr:serine hydrolase domain-containing protein [Tenacibaculum finnmarkense]MCD8410819.1 beta-lactamase family protein [Tenacibaculum finnmarkense genomovar ulcerans]MCD8444146.1 beta-lactamase family protein [Tenacibaculum finnmarkense genomovar ulcerans]